MFLASYDVEQSDGQGRSGHSVYRRRKGQDDGSPRDGPKGSRVRPPGMHDTVHQGLVALWRDGLFYYARAGL